MNTLALDTQRWDIFLDSSGNIAMATEPYAIAQDVASAIKLFKGELYYNTKQGVPHFQEILGLYPPQSLIKKRLIEAALTVPGVVQARVVNLTLINRQLTGEVEVIDTQGHTSGVRF
ncbi:MAG: hypothetical protein ACXWXZ_03950 [Candidatus Binatia bacterium]